MNQEQIMKKQIALAVLATGVSLGAVAQGSLDNITNMFSIDGITTPDLNATNPALATTYFNGRATIALYYAAAGAVTQSQINAINALDGTREGGATAVALLYTNGFVEVSATSLTGSTAGAVSGFVVGDGGFIKGPDTIGLLSPVPTDGSGWLALVVTAVGGQYDGYEGVLAWWQSDLGGNPATAPAGAPANIVMDPDGLNLVLTNGSQVPIPPGPGNTNPAPGTLASISYALPEIYAGGGSGPVPRFNPTNGQLASVSLTFGGAGMEGVEVWNFDSVELYYWFCGIGTFSISLPGSSLAGSTSCSMSTNSGYIASGAELAGSSWGSFYLVTNTSQAADLRFFTGTNSVTVNEGSSFSLSCSGEGRHLLTYDTMGFSLMLDNSAALTYYYVPPMPMIGLTYASEAVLPTFSNLIVGTNYQLLISANLSGTFTNYGPAFAATNSRMVYTQYFDVANGSQLFLRVKTSP
jgi:hypothetical protein